MRTFHEGRNYAQHSTLGRIALLLDTSMFVEECHLFHEASGRIKLRSIGLKTTFLTEPVKIVLKIKNFIKNVSLQGGKIMIIKLQ